jgi:hypothetical protein
VYSSIASSRLHYAPQVFRERSRRFGVDVHEGDARRLVRERAAQILQETTMQRGTRHGAAMVILFAPE